MYNFQCPNFVSRVISQNVCAHFPEFSKVVENLRNKDVSGHEMSDYKVLPLRAFYLAFKL
jgi:hypothetical protein